MKETFLFFLELGYNHVLDYNGLDHFYFLAVMTLPYKLDKWIQLIKWVTIFIFSSLEFNRTIFITYKHLKCTELTKNI